MANKDYYKTLGVSKSASQAEIKRAYRKLAQKHHPDKGNGNEAKFKEISEAYSVVGDEAKRKQYDQFGFVPGSGGAGPGAGGRGPGGGAYNWQDYSNVNINFEDFGGFGDIFDTFFGGGRKSRTTSQRRGADIEATINIDLADVLSGSEKEITLNKWINCDRCKGEGAEPGFSVKTCPTCKGSGQISKATQTFFGTFAQNQICPECEGAGKIPEKKCTKCAGKGRIRESKRLLVKIPKVVDNGSVIKIVGEGEAAERGGKAGNLYLHVAIKGDNRFVRQGANLLTQINISFNKAILGTVARVPIVGGSIDLKIPAGTQPGQVIKVIGKGFPYLNTSKIGDLLVHVNIEIPRKISSTQKKLLEDWDSKKGWF